MNNILTPSATPMPVSSFFCDQFEAETPRARRASKSPILNAVVATLGSAAMWLTHVK